MEVTDARRQLHGRIRAQVSEITERLWGDLPADNLATAGCVLYGRLVLTLAASAIAEITWFADSSVSPHFGLPRTLASRRT